MIQVIHPSCNLAGKNQIKAVIPTCLYKAVCFGAGGSSKKVHIAWNPCAVHSWVHACWVLSWTRERSKTKNDVKCFFPIRAHRKSALTVGFCGVCLDLKSCSLAPWLSFFPNTYAFGIKGIVPRKKEGCKHAAVASLDMENLEKHLLTIIPANITLKIHSPSKRSGTKKLWWIDSTSQSLSENMTGHQGSNPTNW